MHGGNEPSGDELCSWLDCLSHFPKLPVPSRPPLLQCWSISVGRSASCIPFLHCRTPQRACTHSLPLLLQTTYVPYLTIIYCLDIILQRSQDYHRLRPSETVPFESPALRSFLNLNSSTTATRGPPILSLCPPSHATWTLRLLFCLGRLTLSLCALTTRLRRKSGIQAGYVMLVMLARRHPQERRAAAAKRHLQDPSLTHARIVDILRF
jgi:hypothetical protein